MISGTNLMIKLQHVHVSAPHPKYPNDESKNIHKLEQHPMVSLLDLIHWQLEHPHDSVETLLNTLRREYREVDERVKTRQREGMHH